ncbi:type II and III secretion system protein [Acetonema longum DSM 6540]|uniref:Type II and III secretion system protein n=1 Tax=Acetonema longum DSM 6540 TaxID=1009370 RepID=F7NQ96_9FIRM|nr:type II and III secretion system protein [Acetonema longum DSM 6540]
MKVRWRNTGKERKIIKKYLGLLLIFCLLIALPTMADAAPIKDPVFLMPKIIIPRQNPEEAKDKTDSAAENKPEEKADGPADKPLYGGDLDEISGTEPIAKVFPDVLLVENGRITIQMVDAVAIDIVNSVADKLDKKILINSRIPGRVSVRLSNATLEELLNLLGDNVGFTWTEKNGVIIITTRGRMTSPVFFPVQYANMQDIKTALSILGLGGSVTVSANPPGIIVNAPPDQAKQVGDLIAILDCKTPSIKVEFMVVEINKNEENKIGVSWQDIVGTYTHTSSYDQSPTRIIGREWKAGVVGTALETKNIGKILAKPYIITLNNIEAHLSTGDEVPIFSKDINGSPTVEYKKVGIELYTTPAVVNFDEQLLKVKAKTIVNIISGKETQNNLTAPQISSREAEPS